MVTSIKKLAERVDCVITCYEVDGFARCVNLNGVEVLAEEVPQDADALGSWLWHAAEDALGSRGKRLRLVTQRGGLIWEQQQQGWIHWVHTV